MAALTRTMKLLVQTVIRTWTIPDWRFTTVGYSTGALAPRYSAFGFTPSVVGSTLEGNLYAQLQATSA
jgi:hypothetical protein